MNWTSAIERWRLPLIGHVAELFAEIGLTEGGTVERVPKPVYRYVLGILRTAESAVRRLIVAAARDIVVEPRPRRPARAKPRTSTKGKPKSEEEAGPRKPRRPLFSLFDPRRRLKKLRGRWSKRRGVEPRIHVFPEAPPDTRHPIIRGLRQPEPPTPPPPPVVEKEVPVDDGMVSAKNLVRRLFAVMDALRDIPRQAMRLALWEARPKEERRPDRWSPLRSGRPPGFRQRPIHEVDEILKECHWLARSIHPPLDDTS